MQRLPIKAKARLCRAVNHVACHGMLYVCHVYPYLMGAACLKSGFYKGICTIPLQHTPVGNSLSSVLYHRHALSVHRMPAYGSINGTRVFLYVPIHNGNIGAAGGMLLKLCRK